MTSFWRLRVVAFFGLCVVAISGSFGFAQSATQKPTRDTPETFKELVRDPLYKNADLFVPLGAPVVDVPKWEEHKRATHLKALKRSNQDHPDLRREVQLLTDTGAQLGYESSFEKVGSLTIFRFTNFDRFIKDKATAIALGKAMFWDTRFSSDQKVACASCHYAAGVDHRTSGTVSLPVNFGVHFPWPSPLSTTDKYLPYNLSSKDLANGSEEMENSFSRGVFDPKSLVDFTTREVIGSQGMQHKRFVRIENGSEIAGPIKQDPMSGPGGVLLDRIAKIEGSFRQVTQRNAGTVINAVFNSRNFHDSRASFIFNGRSGWGRHENDTVNDALFVLRNVNGKLEKTTTWNRFVNDDGATPNPYFIANASLASQAVEPIVSDVEMSYSGRMMHHVADRMLDQKILEGQQISVTDSSLGKFHANRPTYRHLIKEVFQEEWWNGGTVKLPAGTPDNPDGVTLGEYDLMEANFSLFWGLAIQIYESTLISDDTPFDREQRAAKTSARALAGDDASARSHLTYAQRRGLEVFRSVGCAECHVGAEFTGASFAEIGLITTSPEDEVPAVLGDEDDIVAGAVKCPENKPLGVECMNQKGRMHSIYDGGNYGVGASRFERAPSYPDSPAIRGIDKLEGKSISSFLFDSETRATLEDNGNGSPFLPPEYHPANTKLTTAARWQREQLRLYLEKNNRFNDLLVRLGASEANGTEATQPDPNATQETKERDALNWEKGSRPLNNTQQRKDLKQSNQGKSISDFKKSDIKKVVNPPSEAAAPTYTEDDAKDLKLVDIEIDGVKTKLVTPTTSPPGVSISRRFLDDWQASLPPEKAALKDILPERIADAGAFKAPTLRNIELTGPYMHNGSLLTLEAVVEFYSRGGDFNARVKKNEEDIKTGDKHPAMEPLNLSSEQKADLVAFLKSLTDERVSKSMAPFDHPELPLVVGYKANENGAPVLGDGGNIEYRVNVLPATPTANSAKLNSFEEKLIRGLDH